MLLSVAELARLGQVATLAIDAIEVGFRRAYCLGKLGDLLELGFIKLTDASSNGFGQRPLPQREFECT